MSVATISHLTVRYGTRTAVTDLDLEIPEGSVGLLGPNGAGKTTLIKTLLGLLRPASGSGSVLGLDIVSQALQVRQHVGFMPEQDCHIPGMNAVTFVSFAGELSGMPPQNAMQRAHEVLQYCGLGEARYRNVETYSTGMKQRIKLAQALVHGPKLLFLDEPTNGLDPGGRDEMLAMIRDISHAKGVSVIVSSHLLPDIERTCDTVVVLRRGQVVAQDKITTLLGMGTRLIDVELRMPSAAFGTAVEKAGAKIVSTLGTRLRLNLAGVDGDIGRLLFTCARDSSSQVRGFKPALRTLEDVFMESVE
ncbi:MAG: ABC transporter ATP-binding protein [Armatimonadetes bacterium]|nr:ABC transporter ATP-binding protein [Armatimonadota bacterium]MDE2205053.1 ABC transporter ATP-binding protein [Armatimonadota bacterium]